MSRTQHLRSELPAKCTVYKLRSERKYAISMHQNITIDRLNRSILPFTLNANTQEVETHLALES